MALAACHSCSLAQRVMTSGWPLLGDAVLGARRVGRVEFGTKTVAFGLLESDPAMERPEPRTARAKLWSETPAKGEFRRMCSVVADALWADGAV